MKSKTLLLCALAALVTAPYSTGVALGQPGYDVINLGTPLDGSFAVAGGINPEGFLGGYANLPGDTTQHAILWYPTRTKDLGTLGGPNSALLNQFAGFSETATSDPLGQDWCETGTGLICLPITVKNGRAVSLPLLGGNNGAAFGNNDLGQVAGAAQTTALDPSCLVGGKPVSPAFQTQTAVPVVWTNGRARPLPVFAGDSEGSANAINNLGQATGSTGDCTNTPSAHAVLWKDGKAIDLGNLGGVYNNPFGINDLTQVTGTSDLAGDLTSHAFLWQNGVMKDLGTLPGDYYSVGYSVNNFGQVVGQSCDATFSSCRGFLWQNGKMIDLNTLIPSNSPLYLYLAATIDDFGVIVGYAFDQTASTSPAFVAIPKFTFGGLEADSPTAHIEAVPRVALPEGLRVQIQQTVKRKGARRIGPR